jgi:hypothetical protein
MMVRRWILPARCHAVDKPAKPPPTMATFKFCRSDLLVADDEAKRRARRGRGVPGGRRPRRKAEEGLAMVVLLGKRQQQASKRTATEAPGWPAGMSSSLWLCGGVDVSLGCGWWSNTETETTEVGRFADFIIKRRPGFSSVVALHLLFQFTSNHTHALPYTFLLTGYR